MIFLTVGTHEPFDRLVRAVDLWCRELPDAEVFGQITDPGPSRYRPKHFEWTAWLTPQQHEATAHEADFVISHAGIGSMIAAMSASKTIVVLPRRQHLHETRNDHQLATAQRWQSRPGVFVAFHEGQLPGVLAQVLARRSETLDPLPAFAPDELTGLIKELIHHPARIAVTPASSSRRWSIR